MFNLNDYTISNTGALLIATSKPVTLNSSNGVYIPSNNEIKDIMNMMKGAQK